MRAYFGPLSNQSDIIREFAKLFSEPPKLVALDTETVSLKDTTLLGLGIAIPGGHSFWFSMDDPTLPWHLVKASQTEKIWHNATFDLAREVLGQYDADIDNIHDTTIITRLLNIDTELSLAAQTIGLTVWSAKELLEKYKAKNFAALPIELVAEKCCRDAQATLALFLTYYPKVSAEYYNTEKELTSLLLHMSHRGIKLDQE